MNNKPAFGNSKQKILRTMNKDHGEDMDVEYRLSSWVQIDNGWDSMSNRPVDMSSEQKAQVDEVVNLTGKYNIQLSMQIQERKGNEIKDYPLVARWRLFFNKDKNETSQITDTSQIKSDSYGNISSFHEPQENHMPPMDIPDAEEKTLNKGSSMWGDL